MADNRDYLKKGIRNLQDAMHSKAYFKLGDAIANTAYCMAKAKITIALHNRLDIGGASKVSATILRDAAAAASEASGTQIGLGARGGAHEKADIAEAVIGYGWVFDLITLDECAGLIAAPYIERKPQKVRDEFEAFVAGFSAVLARILERA